ncbi:MAG: hypothetical protein EZS28_017430 [Streblomastix strix]|uniref:Uncharacterized protein n=1 Tax=Streblomastix strix TaxID=222440 RepID=A0A5J4VWD9_9EUKA|nr:MAG: hypothetical protein EZS28_017430 [Streblomastix strix]
MEIEDYRSSFMIGNELFDKDLYQSSGINKQYQPSFEIENQHENQHVSVKSENSSSSNLHLATLHAGNKQEKVQISQQPSAQIALNRSSKTKSNADNQIKVLNYQSMDRNMQNSQFSIQIDQQPSFFPELDPESQLLLQFSKENSAFGTLGEFNDNDGQDPVVIEDGFL